MYLRRAEICWPSSPHGYPFDLPAVRALESISFAQPVTFFVGENGSGKSTILEALAIAAGFNPEGGSINFSFHTYDSHAPLSLRLIRDMRRPRDGYFLRAESFYNVASYIEALDREPGIGPLVKTSYGGNLHERSHGEAFLSLMQNRLGGQGLYLLDEPEAALSPARQLTMLALLHDLVEKQSQFVIA
ncbi:MAG: AAA family ATPase, partial [Clostridia bacterium]